MLLDTIKALSTTSQINVICDETAAIERRFRSDPQLERRFSVMQYSRWTAGAALQRFLVAFERARPLMRLDSGLASPELMRAVMTEGEGITHRIMQCLNAAAMVAVHATSNASAWSCLKCIVAMPGRVLAAQRAANFSRSSEAGALRTGSVGGRSSIRIGMMALPHVPTAGADEFLTSWPKRIAIFYGLDLAAVCIAIGPGAPLGCGVDEDLDADAALRDRVVRWTGVPDARVPRLIRLAGNHVVPLSARVAYCPACWVAHVRADFVPHVQRSSAHWHRRALARVRTWLAARCPRVKDECL